MHTIGMLFIYNSIIYGERKKGAREGPINEAEEYQVLGFSHVGN